MVASQLFEVGQPDGRVYAMALPFYLPLWQVIPATKKSVYYRFGVNGQF